VRQTLEALGLQDIPVVTAINKIDLLPQAAADPLRKGSPNSMAVSALTGEGVPELLEMIERVLYSNMLFIKVKLPHSAGRLLNVFYEEGAVESLVHRADGILIHGRIPASRLAEFRPYLAGKQKDLPPIEP